MTPAAWSWLLTTGGCAAMLLAGSGKSRLGWGIALLMQPIWIFYSFLTGQTGFIVGSTVYGVVYTWNLTKSIRNGKETANG